MHSPVNWALLGLVIERPSYAYELAQRFERTYQDALSLSSVSHVYTALTTLKSRGLIEEVPGKRAGRQPKPGYRATAKGLEDYRAWLLDQLPEERRRQRLFVLQLAALTRNPQAALEIVADYERACLKEVAKTPLARKDGAAADGNGDLIARLVSEEHRLAMGAKLAVGAVRAAGAKGSAHSVGAAMSLLALENVGKSYRYGLRQRVVLREATLELDAGELAAVWGPRRSGRSTLLRVAAGIEAPDSGVVRFEGHDMAKRGEKLLGGGIGYCQKTFRWAEGTNVLDHVIVALLARGVPPSAARVSAREALQRVGAERCANLRLAELDSGEAIRVALARTLALRPRLLVIDEPTKGVELLERDEILGLLRGLADEGVAVLASAGESTGLSGADRAFALGDGELRGGVTPELAPVLPLRRPAPRRASG